MLCFYSDNQLSVFLLLYSLFTHVVCLVETFLKFVVFKFFNLSVWQQAAASWAGQAGRGLTLTDGPSAVAGTNTFASKQTD